MAATPDPSVSPVSKLNLSRIRHDLRTPINHILGYCEMLQEEATVPEDFQPDLKKIHAGGRQLLALTICSRKPVMASTEFPEGNSNRNLDRRRSTRRKHRRNHRSWNRRPATRFHRAGPRSAGPGPEVNNERLTGLPALYNNTIDLAVEAAY